MEFGVYIRPAATYSGMLELSRHTEGLGLFGAFINDHVQSMSPEGKEPYLESWTALSGIGVQTSRIRLGHITLFNSLRNPAFLAKSIATLDRMTDGRYELIIGAGWNEPEYVGYDLMEGGRGMPSPRERVDRLRETLQILRGMLTNEVFSFDGRYWKLKDAINVPPPLQRPFRISVGAEKPRMIRITAKHADGINASGGLAAVSKTVAQLEPELERNGKRLEDFFVSGFAPQVTINKDEGEYESMAKRIAKRTSRTMEEVKRDIFAGTPEILVEKFRQAEDLGVKMMIVYVRPARTVEEMKERLTAFKDSVIEGL